MAMTTTPTTHMGGSLLRLECWPHRPGASMRTRDSTRESIFQQIASSVGPVTGWPNGVFLTSHARALLCIADDPGVRLRDIAATLGITERSAFAIVTDLAAAGYVVKERDGRRNRYEVQHHLP
jgi:hypothetical protein